MIPVTGGTGGWQDVKFEENKSRPGPRYLESSWFGETRETLVSEATDYEVRRYTSRHWQLPAALTTRRIPDAWPVMGMICGGIRGETPGKPTWHRRLSLQPPRLGATLARAEADTMDLLPLSCFRGRRGGGCVLEGSDRHGMIRGCVQGRAALR